LALAVSAVFASVCAAWAGNFLARDGTRTRLLQVVGATEGAALFVAVFVLAGASLRLVLLGPLIYVAVTSALALAIEASVATWRLRSHGRAEGDGRLTVGLLALAVVSVPVTIFVAWLAGLTGA
jgi:hypothetical protein